MPEAAPPPTRERAEREAIASGAVEAPAGARAQASLWLDSDYRRSAARLFALNLGKMVGWRALGVLALAPLLAFLLAATGASTPRQAQHLFSAIAAAAAIILVSGLHSDDLRRGSLELLWLASGSARALLRMKATVLVAALVVLLAPSAAVARVHAGSDYPVALALLFAATTGWLVIALVAWIGTFVPQGWLAAFGGVLVVAAGFVLLHDAVSPLNPLLNPVSMGPALRAGGGAFAVAIEPSAAALPNRVIVLLLAFLLQSSAARRLSRVLK